MSNPAPASNDNAPPPPPPVKGKRGRKRNVTLAENTPASTAAKGTKKKKKPSERKKNPPNSLLGGGATASNLDTKTDHETEELIRTFERDLEFDRQEEDDDDDDVVVEEEKQKAISSAAAPPKVQEPARNALSTHVQIQGGNFETTIIQVRKRSDRVINSIKILLQDPQALNNGRQTVAECLLVMEEMARHLVTTQTDFERTIRQLKCRAWTGSVNDSASESLGPYALAPTWR